MITSIIAGYLRVIFGILVNVYMDDTEFDNSENNPPENGEGDGEEWSESDDPLDQDEDPYAETKWIDEDINYEGEDITNARRVGIQDNLQDFVNNLVTNKGIFSKKLPRYKQDKAVRLIRSFLTVSEGLTTRPLLNNESGLEIIRGVSFGKGGGVRLGGHTLTLSYRGLDVRLINTSRNDGSGNPITNKLNVGSDREKEFTELVEHVVVLTSHYIESLVDETGASEEVVSDVVSENEYAEHTPEVIEAMIRDKNRHGVRLKPGEKIDRLLMDLGDETIFDGTGNDPVSLPDIPQGLVTEIVESAVSEIRGRLHERVSELTEQEIRELSGMLNPKGDADTKIEALDQLANEYRLKALRETNKLKEQLYRSFQEVAELKSDLIHIVEKGGVPKYSEARVVFEEEVDGNESIEDLSRLERFKKWMKKNWLTASSLAVGLAGLMTTLIIGLRHNIKIGANAVGSFGRSVYNAFRKLAKKLGPVLGPMITALGSLILNLLKYGAMGLAWLASNLWVLVLAIVWMVYDRYGKK